jgi:hypothetical protein
MGPIFVLSSAIPGMYWGGIYTICVYALLATTRVIVHIPCRGAMARSGLKNI